MWENIIGSEVVIKETGKKAYITDLGVFEGDYVLDDDTECHIYSRNEFIIL